MKLSNPKKIVISRTDSIGDVALTLPLAGILKSKYPDVRIKTHLVKEHIDEEVQKYLNKLIH